MLYAVIISIKGGYKLHSVHPDLATAQAWAKCKEHDGDDTTILTMDAATLEEIERFLEERKK